jgi:hypothetical protein
MSFNLSGRGGLLPTGFDPISSITGGGIGDDGGNGGKGPRSDPLPITSSLTRSVPSSYVITRKGMRCNSNVFPQGISSVVPSIIHGVPAKVCGQISSVPGGL